jgi:hypothetical protein
MKWNTVDILPPMSDYEWRGIFKSPSVLIKTVNGRFVVGYAEQYEGYDVEWIENGRDGYHIPNVEKWAFIED